ncbi:molecular chaperone GrpE [Gracilibacillus halotolerans]|uniref:Protein GrpE n=1 Tax=Gracilibacillus halotolerans TaxID=74386 RepID=A0A841RIY5_9BACI|nr:nucleotide exchange factor GrpE [Gracilibacillus halotolerans]MBB6511837.1 molecular chaperone GrpE [Gracilibacillus halotolerans]
MEKEQQDELKDETVEAEEMDIDNIPEEKLDEQKDEQNEEAVVSIEDYQKLVNEHKEMEERLLRVQAEYDNFRKRSQREKEASLKYKSQDVIEELLPVMDNFERALQVEAHDEAAKNIIQGVDMIYRQLHTVLENQGVSEIKTVGEVFDPNLHQAIAQVNEEGFESGQITETLQKGYQLKDRVIRPAMVKVNE